MVNNKNKTLGIVLGIFALVIVTTAASFAFFTYSRTGNTTTTITSGDIEFSYNEGASAELANAFPVSDTVGAQDTTKEYTFTVNMKSSSTANKMNYNVYLLDANDTADVDYFNNEQIKFSLVKNGTYVADTSSSAGKKLSEVAGFAEESHEGEGLVLQDQEIASNVTDTYKLRIWISDDVKYTNTIDGQDEQTSIGKYNGYKYSLKVKVTAGMGASDTTVVQTPTVNNLTMTTEVSDPNGLDAYAVTTSKTAPEEGSSEWITITDGTAKNNVVRTANVTTKTITFMVKKNGTHYLHIKNKLGQVKSESFTANATGEKATTKIMNLASTNTNELRIDEHEATGNQDFATTEYRYWGATPNNYVWFNNELWRIIGAMDVDDGTGTFDKRLKIIRANPIGNYSWDSSDENTNKGYGVNEWSQADLMALLNSGAYYNRTTGTCYNNFSNVTTPCDFSANSTAPGLTSEAKEMIGNAKWYLGAGEESYFSLVAKDYYTNERGSNTGKQCIQNDEYCSDTVERKTYWTGQIGLIYPSDYGYAANMNSCSNTILNQYGESCKDSTWLFNNGTQWTLSPRPSSSDAYIVLNIDSGNLSRNSAGGARGVSPVTYLTKDIKILDGDGTTDRPFVLSK